MANFNIPYINNNMMIMPSISTVGQVRDTAPVVEAGIGGAQGVSFADFLQDAISNTVSSDYETKAADVGMLVGEVQDLHTIGLAGQKADIMLSLTVQIRDRVIEAYQEIMRMQV